VGLLFLLFTLVPFIELYLLIQIGQVVGAWYTILFVVAMGVVGALLAKSQGRKVLREWSAATSQGRMPAEGVLGGVLILVGGLLLITPGVLTDVVGLLFLLPLTRRLFARAIRNHFERKIQLGQVQVEQYGFAWPPRSQQPNVIDTEGEELR
jgi:UPF0716 protein FxsA